MTLVEALRKELGMSDEDHPRNILEQRALATDNNQPPVQLDSLPKTVANVLAGINHNFEATAQALDERASMFRKCADLFEQRAQQLRDAGPHLADNLEKWVRAEQQWREDVNAVALVNYPDR